MSHRVDCCLALAESLACKSFAGLAGKTGLPVGNLAADTLARCSQEFDKPGLGGLNGHADRSALVGTPAAEQPFRMFVVGRK